MTRNSAVSSLIALYKALGGGWHSAQPRVDAASRAQMRRRTDWGDLLDEPTASAAPAPEKEHQDE
ncbi:hypothetical protein D3C78_1738190 [compost metagenome]